MSRVYVGHLSSRTRERDLQDLFSKFGKIQRIDLKYGYGFIVCVLNSLRNISAVVFEGILTDSSFLGF